MEQRSIQAEAQERIFVGIPAAPGIAIGPAYLFNKREVVVEARRISEAEVEAELERFEQAVQRAERDLNKISSVAREKLGEESASVFEAQRLMLRDASVYDRIREYIQMHRCNADYAVAHVLDEHIRRLEASNSAYLRERVADLIDVKERLIRHLRREKLLSAIDPEHIIVAENLSAADVVLFSRRGILGCASDHGGPTSHVSIMARALGVPAVVSLHGLSDSVQTGDLIILDGIQGRVVVNPRPETLALYRTRQERYRRLLQDQQHLIPLPAETLDGHRFVLRANLELIDELDLLKKFGAEGIGLFRTEVLFLMRGPLNVSEDYQLHVYRQIVERVKPNPTTFRLLDLGGDKMLPIAHREHNPFLGWRGLRVLLDRPELLLPQLRALLRASAYGPVRILVPMVTALDEYRRFQEVLEDVKAELRARGEPFDEAVPVGIMVEVPSVALMADLFAEEVDFFSIGTNDLTQYTLAVDRGNDLVAQLYEALHPAVLRLIKHTIDAGHRHGIPVSLCGELAGDPQATPILAGMGLDEFSAAPPYLPEVKRVIRAMQFREAQELAEQALQCRTASEVTALVNAWLQEHGCGLLQYMQADEPAGGNGRAAASRLQES